MLCFSAFLPNLQLRIDWRKLGAVPELHEQITPEFKYSDKDIRKIKRALSVISSRNAGRKRKVNQQRKSESLGMLCGALKMRRNEADETEDETLKTYAEAQD